MTRTRAGLLPPSPRGAGRAEEISAMIDWVPLRTGARPVPSPMATPLVWAAASGGASVLVALLNALIGPDRPSPALVALSLLSVVLVCAPASRRPPAPRCCAGSSSTASPYRPQAPSPGPDTATRSGSAACSPPPCWARFWPASSTPVPPTAGSPPASSARRTPDRHKGRGRSAGNTTARPPTAAHAGRPLGRVTAGGIAAACRTEKCRFWASWPDPSYRGATQ